MAQKAYCAKSHKHQDHVGRGQEVKSYSRTQQRMNFVQFRVARPAFVHYATKFVQAMLLFVCVLVHGDLTFG